tara:strand:- start:6070 stop:6198 length:129 start_codon:yes stop_codon:yes gene_type:complete
MTAEVKFKNVIKRRKPAKSMGWLIVILSVVGFIFWYLTSVTE